MPLFLILVFTAALQSQSHDFLINHFENIPGRYDVEKRVIELVNTERAKAGLKPVSYDPRLRSAARQHSAEMLEMKYFSHHSPVAGLRNPEDRAYATGLSDAVVGENIAVHSFDVGAGGVADHLMDQWMNSPAHRANILEPEFTHLGVGVASFKDSTRRDTIIRGAKGHVTIYTIRHYGTQVFSVRHIHFDELRVEKRSLDFMIVDLDFQFDRDMLGSVGNFNRFFKPTDKRVRMRFEFPADSAQVLTLAALQDDNRRQYGVFFENVVSPGNFLKTLDGLAKSPITVLEKDIRRETKSKYFLVARGTVLNPSLSAVLYLDTDRFYDLNTPSGRLNIVVPLDEDLSRAAFALGEGPVKDVGQQIKLRLKSHNGGVFGKGQ